jgi:hypothetical protein
VFSCSIGFSSSGSICTAPIGVAILLASVTLPVGDARAQCVESGGGQLICGFNGGATSQVFSPGSVIIMQRHAILLPEELLEEPETDQDSAFQAPTMSKTVRTGDYGMLDGLRFTTFVEGIAYLQDQSPTAREPASDSDLFGGLVGAKIDRPGWSASIALDYAHEDRQMDSGLVAGPEGPLPIPGADLKRQDFGVSLAGRADVSDRLFTFAAARVGRIDVETDPSTGSSSCLMIPCLHPTKTSRRSFRAVGRPMVGRLAFPVALAMVCRSAPGHLAT